MKEQILQEQVIIDKYDSKSKGDISESKVLSRLIELGHNVLIPFGDNCRYDMVVEKDQSFYTIQVKTGRYIDGNVEFSSLSVNHNSNKGYIKKNYDEIDFIAVYCPQLDECYICDTDNIPNISDVKLRIDPPKINRNVGIRWAKDYKL